MKHYFVKKACLFCFCLLLALLSGSVPAFGQTGGLITVEGTITDAKTGEALVGASIAPKK